MASPSTRTASREGENVTGSIASSYTVGGAQYAANGWSHMFFSKVMFVE